MAHVKKISNGKYKVRYRDPDNKERSKSFSKKFEADRYKAWVENEINRGSWISAEKGRRTFGYYADLWLNALSVKPSTLANYESNLTKHILPRLGSIEVSRIHWITLETFKNDLLGLGLNPKTVRNVLVPVNLVLTTAVRDGALITNPARDVAKPRIPVTKSVIPATAAEIMDLSATMNDPDRTLVLFAAFTGLRAGECGGIRVGDIDFGGQKICVRRSITEAHGKVEFVSPKNGRERTVPVPPFLLSLLSDLLDGRGVLDEPEAQVFTSRDGGIYRHSNFYKRVFQPAMKNGGREGFRFHDLRHSYASMLIQEAAHPRVIMDRMGHSSIQITMNTYGHLFPSEDQATIDGLERAWNEAKLEGSRPVRGLMLLSRTA